ncbi:MAG: peptide chain release factor-like protein [Nitrospinae bacterium]|nr:peptide chain release factor-like protein [Nitrospinota bacterium]
MFPVRPEKEEALKKRMKTLNIHEKDISESYIRSAGSGGQKVNKTSSCVYLVHLPTKTEVKCQKARSQSLNRYHARVLLCDKIEMILLGSQSKEAQKINKLRKQKQRRSKKSSRKYSETD